MMLEKFLVRIIPTGLCLCFIGLCWMIADPYLDYDGDGVMTRWDNCPHEVNPNQLNADNDRWGDACDTCPSEAVYDWYAPPSSRIIAGERPAQPPDKDDDGVGDPCDNCPEVTNPDQLDSNEDGVGDVCQLARGG